MRPSLRILVVFAAVFASAVGLAQVALGAVGPDAPFSLPLGVPLLLWIFSFAGLKFGISWARRPRVEVREHIPGGASLATHA